MLNDNLYYMGITPGDLATEDETDNTIFYILKNVNHLNDLSYIDNACQKYCADSHCTLHFEQYLLLAN